MSIRIEEDAYGRDTIWTTVDGKGVSLESDSIFVRAGDGAVFIGNLKSSTGMGLQRLGPNEVEMINHYFKTMGPIAPDVFAGDPE